MRDLVLKFVFAASLALVAIGMTISADPIPEAPAGFDGLTNGYLPQSTFDTDATAFSDIKTPQEGLGPVYNAVSCTDCHQNMAIGGAAQIMEFSRRPHFRRRAFEGRLFWQLPAPRGHQWQLPHIYRRHGLPCQW